MKENSRRTFVAEKDCLVRQRLAERRRKTKNKQTPEVGWRYQGFNECGW
jgi:hypothetical protein